MDTSYTSSLGAIAVIDIELLKFDYTGMEQIPPGLYPASSETFKKLCHDKKAFIVNPMQTPRNMLETVNFDFLEFELVNQAVVVHYEDKISVRFQCSSSSENRMNSIYQLLNKEIDKGVYKIDYGFGEYAVLTAAEYFDLVGCKLPGSQTAVIDVKSEEVLESIMANNDDDYNDDDSGPSDIPRGAHVYNTYGYNLYEA
jgi:hypothetical protein